MASVEELSDANYQNALKASDIVVVDVYASWCGSCRLFAPLFQETAGQHGDMAFYKIDGEKNPDFASKIEIDNLPFVAVFHKGQYVGGRCTTKKDALEEMIKVIRERSSSASS
jgi:thioredoxin-like negative regulator of GroEL